MRFEKLFCPTLRQAPAEAEVPSHRLMLQAGMMRRCAPGTYAFLPLGLRVVRKVAGIVRQEMDRAGGQEIEMPSLQDTELWRRSGRWERYGQELFRLRDRHGREMCLGPTHEEAVTALVRDEVRSYRQLPLILYQITAKYRDEVRPRFGAMRGREFPMKDAYSFDRDQVSLGATYRLMCEAYGRIFFRCGLAARPVLADSGAMGGADTHEFVVSSEMGEVRMVLCPACGYGANIEQAAARARPAEPGPGDAGPAAKRVETPGLHTVDAVASFLGVGRDRLLKTLICIVDGRPVAALVRGDHTLSTLKLARALGARELALAEEADVERITGAALGFAGPVGLPPQVDLVADLAVTAMDDAVAGANASDFHLVHVRPGRDFTWRMAADIREAEAGDGCPECGAVLQACRGIEVGHVFKLGTKYGEALGATFTDQAGAQVPLQMGCYGIGIGRTAAAIVEAHHDEHGISWPLSVAPYQVLVLPLTKPDSRESLLARELYAELRRLGVETLLDDRDERAGVKFADADLIGIPLRVTVGPRALARGQVELRERATGLERSLGVPEAPREVAAAVARGLLALDPDAG